MSLGYTGLLADIYWTRAVQYFGEQHHSGIPAISACWRRCSKSRRNWIRSFCRRTSLGPTFWPRNRPAARACRESALSLMKYGIEHNPDQWRLYYNLGFLYYTEFKDYAKAADAFAQGATLPVTNAFMPILAARMAQHAGEFDTARMLWVTTYQSTKDAQIRQNAVEHLLALQVDEEVTRLEQVVEKYREQSGRLPASMGDLERAGFIRGTPADPKGRPVQADAGWADRSAGSAEHLLHHQGPSAGRGAAATTVTVAQASVEVAGALLAVRFSLFAREPAARS